MSRSVNKVILLGHLGRAAETAYTPSQVAVTKFSVACNRRYKQDDEWKEVVDWVNVVAWRMEKLAPYLDKGKQVYIEGRLQTRNYERDGAKVWVTEVVADQVILCGGQRGENGRDDAPSHSAPAAADGITDDDVPF